MKNEIIKSLTETQTVVLDTVSTSQRMLTANKNTSDAPETPTNTTYLSYSLSSAAITTATITSAVPTATATTAKTTTATT